MIIASGTSRVRQNPFQVGEKYRLLSKTSEGKGLFKPLKLELYGSVKNGSTK